ncbi:MAG: hypothetical protein JO110_30465 [Acetobacteraceae bacterium]|nr:hypothetical protein [Acetobacteraceae bacterium]
MRESAADVDQRMRFLHRFGSGDQLYTNFTMHKPASNAIARNSPTGGWRKRAQWAQRKLEALPAAMWVIIISTAVLAVFSVTNVVYQVLRKPTEVFAPISNGFNKLPSETWRQ